MHIYYVLIFHNFQYVKELIYTTSTGAIIEDVKTTNL